VSGGLPRFDPVATQATGRQEFVIAGVLPGFAIRPLATVKEDRRCALVVMTMVTPLAAQLDQARVGRFFHAAKHWVICSCRRPHEFADF
jgi:hypothetical protein